MITVAELLRNNGIDTWQSNPGRQYLTCPRCSALRKRHNQKKRCLSLMIEDAERAYWKCHHCGWSGPEKGTSYGLDGKTRYEYPNGNYKVKSPRGFVWEHESVDLIIRSGAKGLENILYRIEEAREVGGLVAVVEGEKDAETLWKLGVPAVTSAHGAAKPGQKPKWNAEHSRQLQGLDIVVLNDNDEQGYAHAAAVVECSVPFAKSIRRLDLKERWPGGSMPVGADISDYWAEVGGREGADEAVRKMVQEAPLIGKTRPKLPFASLALDGQEVPQPEYTVQDRIPARNICLFSGHGGTGKSILALQLCVAHVLARDWLFSLPEQGPAMFIDAEDDFNVIWQRLEAMRKLYNASYQDLIKGGLHILPMAGEDTVMAVADRNGKIIPTDFYNLTLEAASDIKPAQLVIASAANVFAGNENDRAQVQQFAQLLVRIALRTSGSVILIAHPSRRGMDPDGGTFSGSTAWHNSFRARIAIEGIKDEEDNELRKITFHKNQYGPLAENVTLRWKNGLFLPEPKPTAYDKAVKDDKAENICITMMGRFSAMRLSPNKKSPTNYAPRMFAEQPECQQNGLTPKDMEAAMNRLIAKGRIEIVPDNHDSKLRPRVVLKAINSE